MQKQKVIVVASASMDGNKKKDRNENMLVRMPKKARQHLRPKDNQVELYDKSQAALDRFLNGRLLKVHQAFSSDVRSLKELIRRGVITEADRKRVCFVSSDTFRRIAEDANAKVAEAWIADSIVDVLVGADPEFILMDRNGNTIRGDSIFHENTLGDELGIDSFGLQVEVRPPPEVDPSKLVKSMRKIMKSHRNAKLLEDYTWYACSYSRFCVGGHLHFGTPKMLEKYKDSKLGYFVVATRILDELIGLPLAKVEGDGGVQRRKVTRFGKHGDFRKDTGRLEWRVPGGDWLAHPKLAQAVIGASKAVCEEILYMIDASGFEEEFIVPAKYREGEWKNYKGPAHAQDTAGRVHFWGGNWHYRTKEENNWGEWPICESFGLDISSTEIAQALHNCTIKKQYMDKAKSVLTNMSTYRDYTKDIDAFLEICSKTKKSLATINRDIRNTWLDGGKMFK